MATPGWRVNQDTLNIAFDYTGDLAVGDRVEIAAARKVKRLTGIGNGLEVGTVVTIRGDLKECVVATKFRENRQDRIAGEQVAIGGFVFGPSNKVYQYTPVSKASHTGTATGPVTVVASTSDIVKITLENGAAQTVTLDAGVGVTLATIADALNAGLTGLTASIDAGGHLVITCDDPGRGFTINTDAKAAYTLLGWTAAAYAPTYASHDPNAVAGLVVVGGGKDAAVETLEE